MKAQRSPKNKVRDVQICEYNNKIRNTVYTYTNRIGGREIKTLKDYSQTNLEEGFNINEALNRLINTMRTTVHLK